MDDSKRVGRRRHAADLERQVLAACAEPGASVAQVAPAHGLNANLVHKWRRMVDARGITLEGWLPASPVRLAHVGARPFVDDIHVELRPAFNDVYAQR